VLKSLFGGSRLQDEPEAAPLPPAPLMKKPSPAELKQIMDYFPIGKKIRYSPEYKKEVILDTVILAYCVEGEFVYSWDAIEFDADSNPSTFLLGPQRQRVEAVRVSDFQFLVPDTTDQENTLDYPRRAMIGRNRQFHKGNTIALISNAGALGLATMETEVDKKFVLKSGPYAHSPMVLLTPQLHTLNVTDQRNTHRAKVNVPVTLTLQDRLRGPCIIVDISDLALRIRVREGHAMPPMEHGDDVTIDIDFGNEEPVVRIKAAVLRRSADACVVQIVSHFKDRSFVPLAPLDMMELKAGLLNYGK
jgi:hypothetical protein